MPNRPLPSLQPEEWLAQRLANVATSDPHYEASWYGPYNALFSHYFPYQQHFLVKPQPRIRESCAEEGDFSFSSIQVESSLEMDDAPLIEADVSVSSMGGLVFSDGPIVIPDFIVAKATEFASHDRALVLVEVKACKPETYADARTNRHQLHKYMHALADQLSRDTKLVGLLICGTDVSVSSLDSPASSIHTNETTYDINSTTIRQLLLNVAEDNWDC